MPTKILYIVGTGSKNCDAELRWSLRSLEKHALDDVEPVIVGNVPTWFKGDALPCGDKFDRKEKNLNRKIIKAIEARLVKGEFQISADDHFWIAPTEFANLPIYFREGLLPDFSGEGNNYEKALSGTRQVLLNAGYSPLNTTCHCNAWAHAYDLLVVQKLIEESDNDSFARKYGLVAWAVWPNVAIDHHWHRIEQRKDLKYRGEKDFNAFILGADMFSINDLAFGNDDFIHFMKANFDKPSRWEK